MAELKAKDLVAIISIVGILLLKFNGLDGELNVAGALILGYYFAHRKNKIDSGE